MTLNQLAGNGTEGAFLPFQLYAGESDIITDFGTVTGGQAYLQFTVMGKRADGLLVAYAPGTADEAGRTFSTGTLNFEGQPTATDTITINGHPITWIANGATPVGAQVALGTTATLSAQALKTFLSTPAAIALYGVDVAGTGILLTLTAETVGVAGNSIGLVVSGAHPVASAATLTGGADVAAEGAREGVAFCILAQAVDATAGDQKCPVFTGGVFNIDALVWPAGVTTEADRRAAFDRSPIAVKKLK